ncbi:ADP-ribosylation factor H-like [Hibiscus syriacus]|uniref:ADP-ribosylation factor H-like n=1 Tax=Hibiscus syriacus TaxID=106335 RepID=UPI0019221882|nr:ADP-ribosylation factor H-like [Hibiscus syriacus]
MHAKGLTGFFLMRAAGNAVFMIFEDSASLRSVKNDKSETLAMWFSRVEAWSESLNIADKWGYLLAINESCQSPSSFGRAKIQILTKVDARIDATLELKITNQGSNFLLLCRPYWRCYFPNTQAIIYVVDSSDTDRLVIAKEEFHAILEEEELRGAVVLIFANKQDLPGAVDAAAVTEALELHKIKNRQWAIFKTSATKGEGLFEGLDWLSNTLKSGSG